jgi:hypothetical protein
MYREVLAQQMTYGTQLAIPEPEWQWEKADGALDMEALMREFQKFWRKHADLWEQKSNYTEAFPHLLLMAFLQRIISWGEGAMDGAENNAGGVCESKLQYSNRQGGRFEYEYAAGRGRMDLCVEYRGRMYVIEIKLIRDYTTPEEVMEEGLEQIRRYSDRLGGDPPAYLVIFDRREKTKRAPWEERLGWEVRDGITVVRC